MGQFIKNYIALNMAEVNKIEFIVNLFKYEMVFSDDCLKITATHLDEYFVWSTIIDGILFDPQNIMLDSMTRKDFIGNLATYDVFDIFKQYQTNGENFDKTIKIVFPTKYKADVESLMITIDFAKSYGIQKIATKYIILQPENVSKELIMLQRMDHFKSKTNDDLQIIHNKMHSSESKIIEAFQKIDNKIASIDAQVSDVNNFADTLNDQHSTIVEELKTLKLQIAELRSTIIAECNEKCNRSLNKILSTFETKMIAYCESKYAKKT